MAKALNTINGRRVGKTNKDGNTDIYVVYWGDYDYLDNDLNKQVNGVYSYREIEFSAKVTFVI